MRERMVRPYGDTQNDGKVQLSFTLPVEWSEAADEAARRLVSAMGFTDVQRRGRAGRSARVFRSSSSMRDATSGGRRCDRRIRRARHAMTMDEIDASIRESIGRKVRVAGACIGTDAHTVGIDAILNMKGYNGDYGLERYREFETYNLGSQVSVEELVRFTREQRIDALLASQAVTQKGSDITNFTAAQRTARSRSAFATTSCSICGGPRVTNRIAGELGYDAGFGRGTLPSQVAAFIAVTLAERFRARTFALVSKTALITGITGQDGSYLAELLLEKGYRVVGMTRRTSTEVHERIEHIVDAIEIVSGDLLDQSSITALVDQFRPDEIYNLAAQSFVPASWTQPVLTGEFTALGVTRVLEAIRHVNPDDTLLSSVEFRNVRQSRGDAAARDDAILSAQSVRRREGLRTLDNGQLSRVVRPLRLQRHLLQPRVAATRQRVRHPENFRRRRAHQARTGERTAIGQSRRTTRLGICRRLRRAMWMMLQQETADDYVIATGRTHSVRDFVRIAFEAAGLGSYEPYVVMDPRFVRPAEVDLLIGDAGKAAKQLAWTPKVDFRRAGHDDGACGSRPLRCAG